MTARFLVGDVFDRMAELDDGSVDLLLTSPPFYNLRSYLPDDHPNKAKEIGSEASPREYMDTLLRLTAEWRRILAPHGSIAVEIGDTYNDSGGAGGDYNPDGLRDGQPKFRQARNGTGPLPKSLLGIPQAYMLSIAWGYNVWDRRGPDSPAGRWRVRNVKPWIRSNPPVGALGDKERPATSYVIVACVARDRWFDLDAVRTAHVVPEAATPEGARVKRKEYNSLTKTMPVGKPMMSNAAGAPPLDWWHHVDAIIDNVIDQRANQQTSSHEAGENIAAPGRLGSGDGTNNGGKGKATAGGFSIGARGVHIRRALEQAGILTTQDAIDVSPKGYSGAHYAVWPPELVRLLVEEMCPRHVCTTCGLPRRRIVEADPDAQAFNRGRRDGRKNLDLKRPPNESRGDLGAALFAPVVNTTVGWSDCGHNTWRPGMVLDPFVGSGTTLAVCTGLARDATGIDIDERNAVLASERVGMFLEVTP